MLGLILAVLIILWLLGYGQIQSLSFPLFEFNGQSISLWNLLTFLVVIGLIGILPRPFREIGTILLILWFLSVLGIIAIAGLSNLLVLAIIGGLVLYIFRGMG